MNGSRLRIVQLGALTLGHFFTDLFGGFLTPLLPSLVGHLHTSPAMMGLIAGVAGITMNTVQPFAGVIIHRFRLPVFLWLGPLFAAGFALMGVTHSPLELAVLVFFASLGVGIFHPSALLGAHVAVGKQDRIGIPIFLSGGAFGVATGAILATQWVNKFGYGHMWWLALAGATLFLLLFLPTGILRLDIHQPLPERTEEPGLRLPFSVLMLMGSLLAINITVFLTYLPMHLNDVLGRHALYWEGFSLSLFSIIGALSSYLWGAVSRRVNIFHLLALGQGASALTLFWLLHARQPIEILLLSALAGFFGANALFPLTTMLARHAIGLTPGLRAGLIIGGCWGIGALGTVLGAGLLHLGWSSSRVVMLTVPLCLLTGIIAVAAGLYCRRFTNRAQVLQTAVIK